MAWTATVLEVSLGDGVTIGKGNAVAVVRFFEDVTQRESIEKTFGDDLSLAFLKDFAAKRIVSLTSRDNAEETLKLLVGQSLTPEKAPGDAAELIQFRKDWRRLANLKWLNSDKLPVTEALAAVETYLQAHPEAIDDPFLGR